MLVAGLTEYFHISRESKRIGMYWASMHGLQSGRFMHTTRREESTALHAAASAAGHCPKGS
jgi:hypothetical protein